jgi:hypothetical protein
MTQNINVTSGTLLRRLDAGVDTAEVPSLLIADDFSCGVQAHSGRAGQIARMV